MSTTTQGPYSTVEDLEATADYPPPPPGAPADTWVVPERASTTAPDDPLRAYQEELRTLRQSVATVTTSRDQLQAELTALTAKRDELQQRLLSKDLRHAEQERDLGARQGELGTLRQSLAAMTVSRDQLQTEMTALSTKRQDLEVPPREADESSGQHAWELGQRDRQIAELTEQMESRAQQHFLITAERDDLESRLERARAEINSAAQKRDRKTSAQVDEEREQARRNAALARSLEDLTELQRRLTKNREALQRAEARRQVFETMLRDREQLIDERDAKLRELHDELEGQQRDHGAALERANTQLAAAIARAGGADRPLADQPQRAPAPDTESAPVTPAATAPDGESQRRIAALEARLTDLQEAQIILQEQLQGAQQANEALRADLGEAELQLHAAESEWQQTHAEIAESQAPAVADAPPARALQRLLVRAEGDAGIVHVLGKRTTIGRIPANDLCIDADFISRHHAVVLVTDSSTVVEDLNSTNGVFVNEVRVTRHALRDGDLLTIGKTSFRYLVKPETALP
jgi:chromosome segregation ATPase